MARPDALFTVRGIMAWVAVAAFVSLVATNDGHDGITDKRVVFPIASVVAAGYGVGAMRRPLMFLLPLIAAWIVAPRVDHPTPDVINISSAGCFLGWIIGAPAGWIFRKPDHHRPDRDPSKSDDETEFSISPVRPGP